MSKKSSTPIINALKETTAFVIAERDCFYEACSDKEGNVLISTDVEALAFMDKIIDRAQAAIAESEAA